MGETERREGNCAAIRQPADEIEGRARRHLERTFDNVGSSQCRGAHDIRSSRDEDVNVAENAVRGAARVRSGRRWRSSSTWVRVRQGGRARWPVTTSAITVG